MRIQVTNTDQKAIIKITGRFDLSKRRNFEKVYEPLLQQAELRAIEIDMDDINFFDSSSLGMLLLLRESAHTMGKEVHLSRPNQAIAQSLEVANFHRLFSIAW